MNGNPRTKWQRKGRLHITKMLKDVVNSACAAAVVMEKVAERINPIALPSGGIVVQPPPKVCVAQMPTSEMVLTREHIARLKHAIDINPMESVRATISAENVFDVLRKVQKT